MAKSNAKPSQGKYPLRETPIAIIGMSSIFPGASNLDEYWDNILRKIDCVMDVPSSRWNAADYYDPDPTAPDKTYNKRGGFLPDIDFDPMEFGLPPNILEVTDVSQLLSLVAARDALEDAGYGDDRPWDRTSTGVILGVVGVSMKSYTPLTARLQYPVWEKVLRASGVSADDTQVLVEKFKKAYIQWEENAFPGALANVVSGRVANRFDLGATNCIIDAACATSLAATKMAIMELVEGRADMMITGGVDTDNSIGVYLSFSKTPAFSKGEQVRTFDADTDGMMAGEGIGMLVLKRLADAERDGDRIYAVIRGVGSSSDGRYKSIYAPRPSGQALALKRAYEEAGYAPSSLGLVEAHGTGTPAGDPAEVEALREVFNENNPGKQEIALGSVKSQIAHTKGAAGAAGLIKIALALHHKTLPATINVTKPNPRLKLDESPFYVNTETRPWFRRDVSTPRRASVSAFGFGGTNFHLTLEEYQAEHKAAYRKQRGAATVLFTAKDVKDLQEAAHSVLERLNADPTRRTLNQLDEESLALALPAGQPRIGFTAESPEEAIELLGTAIDQLSRQSTDAWEHPKGIFYRPNGLDAEGKVVALFSGQGSQYLEMGRELAINFPAFRQAIAEMDALFAKSGRARLSETIYPAPVFSQAERDAQNETLTRTENAQPAIGVFGVGLFRLLQAAGFSADFAAGHSFGELTALWASGVLLDADYYTLARARGEAMAAPADPGFDAGGMLAVKGETTAVLAELDDLPGVTLANYNSGSQVVLAGAKAAIAGAQEALGKKGYSVTPLTVSAAFHTPLVGHAQQPFAAAIDQAEFRKPAARVFSNTTGKEYPADGRQICEAFKQHMLNPVLWRDEIDAIYAAGGRVFVEFGPKSVLTNLVKSILGEREHMAVALNSTPKKDGDRLLREAVLQLRVAGLKLSSIDPYRLPLSAKPPRQNSPATVKLNGGAYVSPKTRKAFEDTLNDGWRVSTAQAAPSVAADNEQKAPTPPLPEVNTVTNPNIDSSLAFLREQQSEVIKLHVQYIKSEEEYAKIVGRLAEQGIELAGRASGEQLQHAVAIFESLERSLARLHEHQSETLRVHARYLESQDEYARSLLRLIGSGEAAPAAKSAETLCPASQPLTPEVKSGNGNGNGKGNGHAKTESAAEKSHPQISRIEQIKKEPEEAETAVKPGGFDAGAISKALLEVAADKTGYPVEMLELDADIEADLGIDSIKRVEIMGALREQFPGLPEANPEAFADVHTLGQIVEYLTKEVGEKSHPQILPIKEETQIKRNDQEKPVSVGIDADALSQALLAVVSDKTGYPVEMLELDADMEADLGIDSIKRVEIMGALREQFLALPEANPEAFADVHTLGQIVAYLTKEAGTPAPFELAAPAVEIRNPSPQIPRGVVRVKPLPQPDATEFRLPEGAICLVAGDGGELTCKLANRLVGSGQKTSVLRLHFMKPQGQAALSQSGAQIYTLTDSSEEGLSAQLGAIAAEAGQVGVLIYLNTAHTEGFYSAEGKDSLRTAFLLAKHLKEPLVRTSKRGDSAFIVVTRLDGEFGLASAGDSDPIYGGLFGLVKTVNLEWQSVHCRAIDLDPAMADEAALQAILDELHDPNRLVTEVGYGAHGRATLTVEPEHDAERAG